MDYMLKKILRILSKFDLILIRFSSVKPINALDYNWQHPLELVSLSNGRDALIEVPMEKIWNFKCGHGNGLNCEACKNVAPISSVNTLKDYLDGKHTKYSGSHMEAWHELKSSGYSLPVAPWRKELTIDNSITVDKEFKRDRKKFGDYSINELHWFRHIDVAKSIKEKGFLVDKKCLPGANIKARLILLEDDKWYVQIYSGLHRMSALAALGYETIILQLETKYVIRYQDRKYWPLLKKKQITEQEVLQYFHKL